MSTIRLSHTGNSFEKEIQITGSKSESNRLLILQALFGGITVSNVSNSDDAAVMQKALSSKDETEVDIYHAGTAMRFLTAYFSIQSDREVVLTGSHRMQERPIGILVDALKGLGADISYLKNDGYPPILIKGRTLSRKHITLKANVSSQYVSALMLIGGSLPDGLTIVLEGKITSVPYIKMTQSLLKEVGISVDFEGQEIAIAPYENQDDKAVVVESDWSSASYFYSIVALGRDADRVTINSYKKYSLQGDASLIEIYRKLGVQSSFDGASLTLDRIVNFEYPEHLELDLSNSPDIAQTIAVTCLGLGIACTLTGLHTLKIKETDRLEALKAEITKLGGAIEVTHDTLFLETQKSALNEYVTIATYHDHRMAMAFAPLALKVGLEIEDAGVVSKSYPDFWSDLELLGFQTQ